MGPPALYKTKAQERERIRQNQQRSRERRRAYVVELEQKVRQLDERLQRDEPSAGSNDELAASIERLTRENDARRELLRAVGVDDVAQQQFMRVAAGRKAVLAALRLGGEDRESSSAQVETPDANRDGLTSRMDIAESLSTPEWFPDIGNDWSIDAFSTDASSGHLPAPTQPQANTDLYYNLQSSAASDVSGAPFIDSLHASSPAGTATGSSNPSASSMPIAAPANLPGLTPMPATPSAFTAFSTYSTIPAITARYDTAPAVSAAFIPPNQPARATTLLPADPASALALAPSTIATKSPDSEPHIGLCLQNTVLHINTFASDGTTACSIAFSMIFQYNARGYSTGEVEKRLQPGYRKGAIPAEGCRVANKVLFQLLAEIS